MASGAETDNSQYTECEQADNGDNQPTSSSFNTSFNTSASAIVPQMITCGIMSANKGINSVVTTSASSHTGTMTTSMCKANMSTQIKGSNLETAGVNASASNGHCNPLDPKDQRLTNRINNPWLTQSAHTTMENHNQPHLGSVLGIGEITASLSNPSSTDSLVTLLNDCS